MDRDKHKVSEVCKHRNGFCHFTLFVAIMLPKNGVSAHFHEITVFRLEGMLGDPLVQGSAQSRVSPEIRPDCSGHYPTGVFKRTDSTTSLDNLFNCLTVLTVKNLFLISSLNLYCVNLCPLSPVLQPRIPLDSLTHLLKTSSEVLAGCC